MVFQPDLLRAEIVPKGLGYLNHFISIEEEHKLINHLKEINWQKVKMFGIEAKRRVAHFGMDYSYESRILTPTSEAPDYLRSLMIKSAQALNVEADDLKEILISHYPVGAPIGWHKDSAQFESLIGISLGSDCVMKFRRVRSHETLRFELVLEQRSAYILKGEARWQWQHHIPPVKHERYSITMRTLRK